MNGWAAQQHIPGYLPDTLPPILLADQNRTVHAFASQGTDAGDTGKAIIYSRWRADIGWSNPIDILLSPLKEQARVMDAYLDGQGIIHLIFFGGDDADASIFYTYAPAALAGSARAWAEPIEIGPKAITPNVAGMVSDGSGHFVMVYSGNLQDGDSLYSVRSADNGETWSDPELIYSTYNLKDKVFDFDLYLGQSGTLHIVWNVTNVQGQNVTGFYAQLEDILEGGWSDPMTLDKNVGLGIAIPAVVEYQGQVIILYNNGLDEQTAPVHWMIRSSDGGKSWTRPVRPFVNHIGRNGHFSFVIDSEQHLYVFFGQRIPGGIDGKLDLHGMWYSSWKGGQWDSVRAVVSGEYRDEVTNSFDPYDADAVISQGNQVLITWRTDPGRRQPNVWFSSRKLEASELPVVPLPLVEPTVQTTATPVATETESAATATIIPTALPVSSTEPQTTASPQNANGPGQVLLIGLVPVGLILMLTALWQSRRKQRF
ncbi:MAG: sialidase family protein [Caldilineaceae bacterium]